MHKSTQVVIRARIEQVFDVLVDFHQTPTWRRACVRLEVVDGGPARPGARLRYLHTYPGAQVEEMAGVVEVFERPHRLDMRFEDETDVMVARWALAPRGGGCEVTHTLEVRPRSLLRRVAAPFMGARVLRQMREDVAALKSYVENAAAFA